MDDIYRINILRPWRLRGFQRILVAVGWARGGERCVRQSTGRAKSEVSRKPREQRSQRRQGLCAERAAAEYGTTGRGRTCRRREKTRAGGDARSTTGLVQVERRISRAGVTLPGRFTAISPAAVFVPKHFVTIYVLYSNNKCVDS